MDSNQLMTTIAAKGLSYQEYWDQFTERLEKTSDDQMTEVEKEHSAHRKLNYQRSARINKTYEPNQFIKDSIQKIEESQTWLVISEDWCGDSSQNLPYIAKISSLNSNIDLKILQRDENLEVIDQYLTNGTRSIPKMIAFNSEGEEIFQWGPRPKEAQELVANLKNQGKPKEEFLEALHLWYGRNRGKNLELEFAEIFDRIATYHIGMDK